MRLALLALLNVLCLVATAAAAAGEPSSIPAGVPTAVAEFGAWGVAGVLLTLNWWLVRKLVCDLGSQIADNGRLVSLLVVILSERPCLVTDRRLVDAAKAVRQAVKTEGTPE